MTQSCPEAARPEPVPLAAGAAAAAPPASPAHPLRAAAAGDAERATVSVIAALSVCHLLNDTIQSLLPAIYPVLAASHGLSFTQVGILTLAFQGTASLLQPAIGLFTDRRPVFRLAVAGMAASLAGLLALAAADDFALMVLAAAAVGLGSAVFHPDASRVARMASGGRYGFAQSLFQVGGNAGSAIGPLLAAFVVLPLGQPSLAFFAVLALLAMAVLWWTGGWARAHHTASLARGLQAGKAPLPPRRTALVLAVLGVLVFSKFIYVATMHSYYTFYLLEVFAVPVRDAQLLLFVYLAAVAAGTFAGGPIGDRFGRRAVIWVSILGVLPFTLALPFAGLAVTIALSAVIGLLTASAFSAIVVYAQALLPGRVGMVSGLFFGFAFGLAGVGAAVVGLAADRFGIVAVFTVVAFAPALGVVTALLPPEDRLGASARP